MSKTANRHLTGLFVSCVAAVTFSATAYAGGMHGTFDRGGSLKDETASYGSMKDAPVACGRSWSANTALTTDYVFRGVSQSDEHVAVQGGFDFNWCRFYAGVWASSLDFGGTDGEDIADIEIDYYAGIKTKLFGGELDTGVIYYTYPNAIDPDGEFNYVELKAGFSREWHDNFTLTSTVYWSPEFFGQIGDVWTIETKAERNLGKRGRYEFVASGLFGSVYGENPLFGNEDSYLYWNAGLTVNVEKFSFDIRYWDTNLSQTDCGGTLCDARAVGTISASF